MTEPADTPRMDDLAPKIIPMTNPPLAIERCDRCGAQSYVRVETKQGGELLFCAHHFEEHLDKVVLVAKVIFDHRPHLTAAEKAAAAH